MPKCKLCGGVLQLLGRLACLLHYRCRDCGMMFTKKSRRKGG